MNTPLLVLTQYVYAKKQDGGFYSGRIEGKESENTYNIEFSDHTRSAVNEDDLVWLGFYSLPPHVWPKSPVIHPVKLPKEDIGFYGSEVVKEESLLSTRPESLKFLNSKELVLNEERKPKAAEKFCSSERCQCSDEKITCFESVTTLSDRTHPRQVRSSVLRLNRKALSQEISQNGIEDSTLSPRLDSRTVEDEWARYDEIKERHFSNTSHGSTRPQSSSYDCHDPPYFNAPCLTPPSTPGSLPPPLFVYKPYETAAYGEMDTREWINMDRRDIGGGKRRRDNMKKCRKVYGIDKRDLWCTQCKWKKACSRFQIVNNRQRHF